jgi:glc operon protein GlcG
MSLSRRQFVQLAGTGLLLHSQRMTAEQLTGSHQGREEPTMETLDLGPAQKILAQAVEKASRDFGRPVCVSVCDKNGYLIAFARMNGSPMRSIDISRRKAYTAIWMAVPTHEFLERLHKDQVEASYFGDETLSALPGGYPLKDGDGNIVGAVGVSGLAPSEDQSIAAAMAELVKEGKI